jgi:hypothetical protein
MNIQFKIYIWLLWISFWLQFDVVNDNSDVGKTYTMKMNSNDKILCENIANN